MNYTEHALSVFEALRIAIKNKINKLKGPHPRQRFSTATAMCSQIAVAVAVDGLPTHAATNLFNLYQFSDSNNVGPRL